jgi:uncharacterized membrane protein YfcA
LYATVSYGSRDPRVNAELPRLPDLPLFAAVIAIVFLSALINGAVGFGFALLSVIALAFVVDPKTVVIVISIVTPIVSMSQVWHHRDRRAVLGRLGLLLAASAIGCIVGTQLLLVLPTWALSIAMGGFALTYVLTALRRGRPTMAAKTERALGPFVGFGAGVLNGAVGASGHILGPYLHAIGLHARDFAFAISSVFVLMSLVRIVMIAALGAYTTASLVLSALIVVPAIVGQRVGFVLQRRIDHRRFEMAVLVLVMLSGLNLVIKGVQEATAN